MVAVENRGKYAGFGAMKVVETVSGKEIKQFLKYHLQPGKQVRTDAFPAMNVVKESHQHEKKGDATGKSIFLAAQGPRRHREYENVYKRYVSWCYSPIFTRISI